MIELLNKNPGSIGVTKKGHSCTVENSNYCYSLSLLDFCLSCLVLMTTEMLLSFQALLELEMNSDLKASLHELYITGAKVSASFAFFLVSSLFKTPLIQASVGFRGALEQLLAPLGAAGTKSHLQETCLLLKNYSY